MTDHQKLLCALLSAEDDAQNGSTTHPTTLEVMALLSGAGAGNRRSPSTPPLAISVAPALQH
jgi:hypothetical protein